MLDYDLHCHSNVSDGTLPPADLVARAAERGVKVLALTDHDDLDGLPEAREAARRHGIELIDGVEVSVTWRGFTIHVVGLNVDPSNAALAAGIATVRQGRGERAKRIADSLAAAGIGGALEGAYRFASNPEMIGRTHFARFMVESGRYKDVQSVFRQYLVKGKPGYVQHDWAKLEDAVGWITGAGGIAAVAHPGRYTKGRKPMGRPSLHDLLTEFVAAGGQAIEVISSSHAPGQPAEFARYAAEFGLAASCGSDFHGPGESYRDIGRLPDFPIGCRPVWELWEAAEEAEAPRLAANA